jgi:hypothetical protein
MANGNALAHHISAESRRHQIEKWRMRDGYISEEIPMKRLDGSLIWVRDTGRVFFDANGQIDFIDGIITDITRQKKEQVSLHQTGKILKRQNRELVSNLKHVENINLQLREAKREAVGPVQVGLPGQHEPRDPHPHEQHNGLRRPYAPNGLDPRKDQAICRHHLLQLRPASQPDKRHN